MAIDPRYSSLISALAGQAAAAATGGMPTAPVAGTATPAGTAPVVDQTAAQALAGAAAPSPAAQGAANVTGLTMGAQTGAIAQPQVQQAATQPATTQPAQPSQLGAQAQPAQPQPQPAPANMPPEAAAQGAAAAQTPSEVGLWDMIKQNLTGHDAAGNMLKGEALEDFKFGHTLGALLGALGAGIGGDTLGGRFGNAVYKQAAGGLSALNNERREEQNNDYLMAALSAATGAPSAPAGQSAPAGPITQPSRQQYSPMTTSSPTGGTQSQQVQTGQLQDQTGTPTMTSLDESLARMRRLSGIA